MSTGLNGFNRCHARPSAEVLLAGTLALMSGYGRQADDAVRELMARKIVINLTQLVDHPQLSERLRCTLGQLQRSWQAQLGNPCLHAAQSALCHGAPEVVQ